MKNKIRPVYGLFWALLAAYLLLSFSSNPPNGFTGAPPTFNTCSSSSGGCHSGGTGMGNVMLSGLPASILPNTTYPITVTVTRTNAVPLLAGFQMVVLDDANNNVGTLSNPGPGSTIQTAGGRTYHEHNPAQPYTNNMATFTVDWTSPASGSGTITMYAAANLANDNGGTSGDAIVTTMTSGNFMGGGGTITVVVTGTNVSCFGGSNGTATAVASGGGGGPYSFMWSNGGNTQTITNLAAGAYSVTVTNGTGGMGTGSISITEPPPLLVNIISQTNVSCFTPIGNATAQASGGVGNYTYNWSTGASGATAILPAGNHTVTATDGNGCTATANVAILSNTTPPIADAGPNGQIDCANSTVQLDGTGSSTGPGFSYQWNSTTGVILSGANTLTPTVGAAGTYTLTVTNTTNGCTSTDDAMVSINLSPPIADAGPDMEINCSSPTVVLNGAASSMGAGFSYQWTTPDGHILSGANTLHPEVDTVGTYCLTVTDSNNGCTNSDCVVVTEDTTFPVANAGPDGSITCDSTTAVLDGSASSMGANMAYSWSTANGNILSGQNTLMPVAGSAGAYVLLVENTHNGCTASDTTLVVADTLPPLANAGDDRALTCADSTVMLDGSASTQGNGLSYHWSTPNGNILSGDTTLMPLVDAVGTYVLAVLDSANGCAASDTAMVTLDTLPPTANAGPDATLTCATNQAILDGSASSGNGPLAYQWSGPGVPGNGDTVVVAVSSPGTYVLTVTDSLNGCPATDTTLVDELPGPSVSIADSTNVLCQGDSTGTATAMGSAGFPPYTFVWSNGDSTAQATQLPAGSYSVTITDSLGCTNLASVFIEEPAPIVPMASATDETAAGANDGTATANPVGGQPPYTYAWSTGHTSPSIANLTPGNYSVTVADANNCTSSQTVTVNAFDCSGMSAELLVTAPLCHGDSSGTVEVLLTGGTAPYSFLWSTGDTTSSVANLPAGFYGLTITDSSQCTLMQSLELADPAQLIISLALQQNVTCFGAADGTATVEAAGGAPPYIFQWSTGDTTEIANALAAGNYLAVATDQNNCQDSLNLTISQPPALMLNINTTPESAVGAADGTATANAAGGTTTYQYNWNTGDTSQTLINLAPGTYCATATDANGCASQACGTVNPFGCDSLQVTIDVVHLSCKGAQDGQLTALVTGATPPLSFQWSNGDTTQTTATLSAGQYQLTLTDANGCSVADSATINQPNPLSLSVASGNVVCPGGVADSTLVLVSGGTPPYTYLWSTGDSTQTLSNLAAGDYTVTVTDAHGCADSLLFEISVEPDTLPPLALAKDITLELDQNGMAIITPQMLDMGSSDNCQIDTMLLDISTFSCDDIGENFVTLTVIDQNTNSSTDGATITVVDHLKPVFSCPPSLSKLACDSTTFDFPLPTATDNCGEVTIVQVAGLPPGSVFPPGETLMRFDATDASGNKALCIFTLTVEPAPVQVSVFALSPACHGDSTGLIEIGITGMAEPFNVLWNTGDTSTILAGLPAGFYSVTVTNALGCEDQAQVNLPQPDLLFVSIDTVVNEESGGNDPHKGAIQVTALGGTPPYSYAWFQNGQFFSNEEDLNQLDGNKHYQLELTDANGCTHLTDSVFVDLLVPISRVLGSGTVRTYPSPASRWLTVVVELPQPARLEIQLLDVGGQVVWTLDESLMSSSLWLNIPVAHLPGGVYILRAGADGDWISQRVAVTRK